MQRITSKEACSDRMEGAEKAQGDGGQGTGAKVLEGNNEGRIWFQRFRERKCQVQRLEARVKFSGSIQMAKTLLPRSLPESLT